MPRAAVKGDAVVPPWGRIHEARIELEHSGSSGSSGASAPGHCQVSLARARLGMALGPFSARESRGLGWAGSCLLQSLLACCSPRTPAGQLVFIAPGSVRAAEDESGFPAASGSGSWPCSGAAEPPSLPQPTFLPVHGWNSTLGRESGWIPNELFLASTWFPSLLMIWKMQTMLWKASTAPWAGSVHFPSFISYNNSLKVCLLKALWP